MSSQLQRPNRPRPPQVSESAATTSSTAATSAATTSSTAATSASPSATKPKFEGPPRKPSRRPEGKRPDRQEAKASPPLESVMAYGGYQAGDTIQLPFSRKTVAITHFYAAPSGTWYAAHGKGFVRFAAIAPAPAEASAP